MPSSMSPSEAMHQTLWSKGLSPGAASGSSRPRSRRAAIAMPTALPMPWPSGPVVVSTPAVWPCSGWPGRQRAPGPQRPEVVELEAVAGQVELDVERQARVAGRQDEPVTAGPARVGRVVAQVALEEQVRRRRQAHRGPGVPVADLLHGVHREDADRVDGLLVQLGPLELLLGAHGRQGSFDEWPSRLASGVLEDGLEAVRDLISPERTQAQAGRALPVPGGRIQWGCPAVRTAAADIGDHPAERNEVARDGSRRPRRGARRPSASRRPPRTARQVVSG